MSVHAGLSILLWFQYAENYARQHTDIGHAPEDDEVHYARIFRDHAEGTEKSKLKSPALIAEYYEASGIDQKSDNRLVERTLYFTIVVKTDKGDTTAAIIAKHAQAERIALQVLARMKRDSGPNNPASKLYARTDLDRWEGEHIDSDLSGAWVGYRISVPVLNAEPNLVYNAGVWDDDAAAEVLTDLTGLTCANINDDTYGLTTEQRLGCVLPQYDFADDTTFEALTPQQIIDLTARLGTDMPYIAHVYADEAEALADTDTVPEDDQAIKVTSTKRLYQGDGVSNSSELVTAQEFLLPAREEGRLFVTVEGTEYHIQLNN